MSLYAVNGKEPVAAWIPSLDTAGNGTTTLSDLVGSNNGTLTDMDAATDWVADTGAGGVRALDFDGEDDGVVSDPGISFANYTEPFTVAGWVKVRAWEGGTSAVIAAFGVGAFNAVTFGLYGAKASIISSTSGSTWNSSISFGFGVTAISLNTWTHIAFTRTAAGLYTAYVNGISDATLTVAANLVQSSTSCKFGANHSFNSAAMLNGWLDDIRIWDQALDATDITYLAQSRGIVVATGNPVGNLQHNLQSMRFGI